MYLFSVSSLLLSYRTEIAADCDVHFDLHLYSTRIFRVFFKISFLLVKRVAFDTNCITDMLYSGDIIKLKDLSNLDYSG